MFSRILFATDGSDEAQQALDYAFDLARRYRSRVYVVHSYAHIPEVLGAPAFDHIVSERVGSGRQILSASLKSFEDVGIPVEGELLEGDLADVTLRVADTRDCELIIIGERSMNQLEEPLLGRPSDHVIRNAKCPVLVIR